MLPSISLCGKNPTFLRLISTPKATSLLKPGVKNSLFCTGEYTPTHIFGRMRYALTLRGMKA